VPGSGMSSYKLSMGGIPVVREKVRLNETQRTGLISKWQRFISARSGRHLVTVPQVAPNGERVWMELTRFRGHFIL